MTTNNPYQNEQNHDPNNPYGQPHPGVPLESLDPEEALEIHIARMREDASDWTIQSHQSRLDWWIQWCELKDIEDLNDLTGRDIIRYRDWRRNQNAKNPENVPISSSTLKTNIDTLRVYLRHAAEAGGVHPMLPEQIDPPTLSDEDQARDVMLDADRAEDVLEYLRKYEYCTLTHVIVEILWHSGMRMGAARSLDIEDCELDDDNPYLHLHHRADSDTPLKNKSAGERPVAISSGVSRLLKDWVDNQRPDTEDDYGRQALLTTQQGRISRTTIRNHVYAITRPCEVGEECPHDREPETCEATGRKQWASKCPGSVSPHAVRRGAITHWLDSDWRRAHVSERANVSEAVIEDHYDQRAEIRKMEQRRQHLDDI